LSEGKVSFALSMAVIETDPMVSNTIAAILANRGHQATVFETFEAAEDAMRHVPFDMILVDLTVDEWAGLAFRKRVGQNHPGLVSRILFLASFGVLSETRQYLARVHAQILYKPFTGYQLMGQIEAILAQERPSFSHFRRQTSETLKSLPQAA
jgi:two-component system, OmpR family, response regulator TctD